MCTSAAVFENQQQIHFVDRYGQVYHTGILYCKRMHSEMAVEYGMYVASFPGHSQMDAGWEVDIFDLLLTVEQLLGCLSMLSVISKMMQRAHYSDCSR